MEKFVKELKETICLNFDSQEVDDLKEATEKMVKTFSDAIVKVNPLFEVKALVPCGSMAEGTRTWKLTGSSQEPVIESDFLAVLKTPAEDEITTIKHCNGFMQVIDDNDRLKHYYNKFAAVEPENALQVESIANSFQMDLLKAVKNICVCAATNDLDHTGDKRTEPGCKNCTEHKNTGYLELALQHQVSPHLSENSSLVLKWTSKTCSLRNPATQTAEKKFLNHVYILVNILPSFQLQNPNSAGLHMDNSKAPELKHECFLVPKTCATNHPTCWKLSYCIGEIQMLQNASLEHKLAFMAVKYMCKCLFSEYHRDGSLPSTYKVKTAALHHIKNCTSKPELTQCVKKILQDLIERYSTQTLPHSISSLNLLAANKTENLPVQNSTWHKNRCELISNCFSVVYNFFENLTISPGLDLQNAMKVLQFIGRTYHMAWRQTEIEPVFKVDQEKLKAKINGELDKPETFADLPGANYADLVVKCAYPTVHWTKKLKVWEYAAVREMYANHRFECPDPPGKIPGREENILLQAQMNCDYFSMAHEDQHEWISKLAHSEDPDDIVSALKAVDMYCGDAKLIKHIHHTQTSNRKQTQVSKIDE